MAESEISSQDILSLKDEEPKEKISSKGKDERKRKRQQQKKSRKKNRKK